MAGSDYMLDAYLAALPEGLDSHPECVVKASVLHDALDDNPMPDEPDIPRPLIALANDLPVVSSFVPEVHFNAIMLAMYDRRFGQDRHLFQRWVFERNRSLLSRRLYRILFVVVSPERLLTGMERRWSAFRRGSAIKITHHAKREASLQLSYPSHLHNEHTLAGLSSALRAALMAAGASEAMVKATEVGRWRATFEAKWIV